MSGEETLDQLFEKARKAPLETHADDVRKWIGLATIGTILAGLLSKLNVVFTKSMIMYSAAFLTASIGLTTFIAFNYSAEKQTNQPATAGQTEQVRQEPTPAAVFEERAAQEIYPREVQDRQTGPTEPAEELPSEVLQPVPAKPLPVDPPSGKSIAAGPKSEEKDYGSFHKIKLRGAVDAYLVQGSKESVRIEGDADAAEMLDIKNSGGTLTIGNAKSRNKAANSNPKVYITVVDISSIDCSGATSLKSKDDLNLKKVEVSLSGASYMELDINLDELIVDLSGATDVKLFGKTRKMDVICSGASNFDASDFQVNDAKVACSGANDTKLYITGSLEISASGASDVKCKGNPAISRKTLSGGASFKSLR